MIFKVLYFSYPFLFILTLVLLGATNAFFILFSELPLPDVGINETVVPDTFLGDQRFYESFFGVFTALILGEFEVAGVAAELSNMYLVYPWDIEHARNAL